MVLCQLRYIETWFKLVKQAQSHDLHEALVGKTFAHHSEHSMELQHRMLNLFRSPLGRKKQKDVSKLQVLGTCDYFQHLLKQQSHSQGSILAMFNITYCRESLAIHCCQDENIQKYNYSQ